MQGWTPCGRSKRRNPTVAGPYRLLGRPVPRCGGPLPAPTVRNLGADLAEALAAVHELGLMHRDVKPSNVLLTLDGPLQVPRRQREFRRRGPSRGTAHHRPRRPPRHTDTFGAVCDDVLTLKRATEKQLVTTPVAARSNRDVCNQAPHTVTLTPVGDDLVYGSDRKDSGRPKARLSKIE
ncbi:hypothetical protein GCM10010340_06410 [Streptomyces griseoloalbus]|nr:hypothetical protein GCM10010340_06410 [Streptomyces albaduncus]